MERYIILRLHENCQEFLFCPTNQNLASVLGRTDFDFEMFPFWGPFGFQILGFPDSQISRFLDFQISTWAVLTV